MKLIDRQDNEIKINKTMEKNGTLLNKPVDRAFVNFQRDLYDRRRANEDLKKTDPLLQLHLKLPTVLWQSCDEGWQLWVPVTHSSTSEI